MPVFSALPYRRRVGKRTIVIAIVFGVLFVLWVRMVPNPCPSRPLRHRTNAFLPRIVHQQWKTHDLPPHFAEWRESVLRAFPPQHGFTHLLWTDRTQRELIANHYNWFLALYDAYPNGLMRADASRVFIMHRYGGLYLDLDFELVQNEGVWEQLPGDKPAVVQSPWMPSNEQVQNALMSSPANHSLWLMAMDVLKERALQKEPRVLHATGPVMLRDAIARSNADVAILPCEYWNRVAVGRAYAHGSWFKRYVDLTFGVFNRSCLTSDVYVECQLAIHHNTGTF